MQSDLYFEYLWKTNGDRVFKIWKFVAEYNCRFHIQCTRNFIAHWINLNLNIYYTWALYAECLFQCLCFCYILSPSHSFFMRRNKLYFSASVSFFFFSSFFTFFYVSSFLLFKWWKLNRNHIKSKSYYFNIKENY